MNECEEIDIFKQTSSWLGKKFFNNANLHSMAKPDWITAARQLQSVIKKYPFFFRHCYQAMSTRRDLILNWCDSDRKSSVAKWKYMICAVLNTRALAHFQPLPRNSSDAIYSLSACRCMTAAILWRFPAEIASNPLFSLVLDALLLLFLVIVVVHFSSPSLSHDPYSPHNLLADTYTTLVRFLHVFHMVSWRSCTERSLFICDWLNLLPKWAEPKHSSRTWQRDDSVSVHKHVSAIKLTFFCFCCHCYHRCCCECFWGWATKTQNYFIICFARNLWIHKEIKCKSDFENLTKR